jgi:hypothetical protein
MTGYRCALILGLGMATNSKVYITISRRGCAHDTGGLLNSVDGGRPASTRAVPHRCPNDILMYCIFMNF